MPLAPFPASVFDHSPSSMTPAASHFWISRRTLLSAIRCSRNLRSQRLVKAPEEVAEVRVEHQVHLLAHDPDRERIQRIMLRAPRPKPVRETEKVLLVNRIQHLDHRPLQDLVLQRSDPERPKPPVRLRYEHPPSGHRPVRPSVDPGVQIAKVRFEILPVVLPRHPIDPRGGLRAERPIRRPQPIDVDVMKERGEPHILVLPRHPAHAIQIT